MNEPEIFVDNIVDTPRKKSVSKMTKPELYEYTKFVLKENMKLLKENANLKFLNSVGDNIENVERIEFLEKQYMKLKKEINNLEKNNQELKELGYRMDEKLKKENNKLSEEHCTVCLEYDELAEDKNELEDKIFDLNNEIVEKDVEISNLKLELEEAKSYEKSFNELKANKDDIEEELSEEINNLKLYISTIRNDLKKIK